MNTPTSALINDLIERTQQHLNEAERLKLLSLDELNWREAPDCWNVLECLEHLNFYGDFYLSVIEESIHRSTCGPAARFKSYFLGNYFAKIMLPREKRNNMKTFKDKNPIGSQLGKATIERFANLQHKTLILLDASRNVNLNQSRTAISIARFITVKLGDTFRIVIYHDQRHMTQIDRVRKAYRARL